MPLPFDRCHHSQLFCGLYLRNMYKLCGWLTTIILFWFSHQNIPGNIRSIPRIIKTCNLSLPQCQVAYNSSNLQRQFLVEAGDNGCLFRWRPAYPLCVPRLRILKFVYSWSVFKRIIVSYQWLARLFIFNISPLANYIACNTINVSPMYTYIYLRSANLCKLTSKEP